MGKSSEHAESEDDFGISATANKVFRESYLSGPRVYSPSVIINALFLLFTIIASIKTGSPWPLMPAAAFATALYALWRVRTVSTQRQFTLYGGIFGGGMVAGFVLIAVAAKVN